MTSYEENFIEQVASQVSHYDGEPSLFDDGQHIEYVRWNILAAQAELVEILDLFSWKPWSREPGAKRPDAAKVAGEIADVQAFLGNIARAAGLMGEDVMRAWEEKIARNRKRQEELYDAQSMEWKCVVCGGELDSLLNVCHDSREHPGLWWCGEKAVYVKPEARSAAS